MRDSKADVPRLTGAIHSDRLATVQSKSVDLPEFVLPLTIDSCRRDAGERFLDGSNEVLDCLFRGLASRKLASERQEHRDTHDRRGAGLPAELAGLPTANKLRPGHLKLSPSHAVE